MIDAAARANQQWTAISLKRYYDIAAVSLEGRTGGGDSGGPILNERGGQLYTYGMASGLVSIFGSTENVHQNLVYTGYGPEVMHMIASAEGECGTITEEGECDGNVRQRCSSRGDGAPHVITETCSEQCVDAPAGATCADSCETDADCAAIAPGGQCDVDSGSCSWSEVSMCQGNSTEHGCLLCCLGRNPTPFPFSFGECRSVCFGPPVPPGVSQASSAQQSFPSFADWGPELEAIREAGL